MSKSVDEQRKLVEEEIRILEEMGGSVAKTVTHIRDDAFARFPTLLLFLSTFGLVATLYGFEKLIDQIPFFGEHPLRVLGLGVLTLAITGTLFKKLQN